MGKVAGSTSSRHAGQGDNNKGGYGKMGGWVERVRVNSWQNAAEGQWSEMKPEKIGWRRELRPQDGKSSVERGGWRGRGRRLQGVGEAEGKAVGWGREGEGEGEGERVAQEEEEKEEPGRPEWRHEGVSRRDRQRRFPWDDVVVENEPF
ncbi:hypothetical protein EI94DRAFT_1699493 [Lactarius quietus]|nr:hypothetical protein EI94DRAFT_1699493 [Lactarius quietus]